MSAWHLYLVRTQGGALYTGIATNVERRFADHLAGGKRAAKYLRSRNPVAIVYQAAIGNRAQALQAEARMKKLPKVEKERIVAESPDRERLLGILALDGADE